MADDRNDWFDVVLGEAFRRSRPVGDPAHSPADRTETGEATPAFGASAQVDPAQGGPGQDPAAPAAPATDPAAGSGPAAEAGVPAGSGEAPEVPAPLVRLLTVAREAADAPLDRVLPGEDAAVAAFRAARTTDGAGAGGAAGGSGVTEPAPDADAAPAPAEPEAPHGVVGLGPAGAAGRRPGRTRGTKRPAGRVRARGGALPGAVRRGMAVAVAGCALTGVAVAVAVGALPTPFPAGGHPHAPQPAVSATSPGPDESGGGPNVAGGTGSPADPDPTTTGKRTPSDGGDGPRASTRPRTSSHPPAPGAQDGDGHASAGILSHLTALCRAYQAGKRGEAEKALERRAGGARQAGTFCRLYLAGRSQDQSGGGLMGRQDGGSTHDEDAKSPAGPDHDAPDDTHGYGSPGTSGGDARASDDLAAGSGASDGGRSDRSDRRTFPVARPGHGTDARAHPRQTGTTATTSRSGKSQVGTGRRGAGGTAGGDTGGR
ncbi:hypothetical protein ACFV3R_08100 [Streptomyces sp. NPDC059740]|uniref:hypothetical protein n=1 Tax=Streptomyces sp. NPDC059740 TaxID=3346926 RepID=UPI00365BB5F8